VRRGGDPRYTPEQTQAAANIFATLLLSYAGGQITWAGWGRLTPAQRDAGVNLFEAILKVPITGLEVAKTNGFGATFQVLQKIMKWTISVEGQQILAQFTLPAVALGGRAIVNFSPIGRGRAAAEAITQVGRVCIQGLDSIKAYMTAAGLRFMDLPLMRDCSTFYEILHRHTASIIYLVFRGIDCAQDRYLPVIVVMFNNFMQSFTPEDVDMADLYSSASSSASSQSSNSTVISSVSTSSSFVSATDSVEAPADMAEVIRPREGQPNQSQDVSGFGFSQDSSVDPDSPPVGPPTPSQRAPQPPAQLGTTPAAADEMNDS